MQAQTYSVLAAIESREALDLVVALLEAPGAVHDLVTRTGVAKSTASRRLEALALAGVVSRPRTKEAYTLTCPGQTREFLEAAHALAAAVLDARGSSEAEFGKRVRRSRLRPHVDDAAG